MLCRLFVGQRNSLIDSKVTPKRESYQEHLPLEVLFFGAGTGVLSFEVMYTILS